MCGDKIYFGLPTIFGLVAYVGWKFSSKEIFFSVQFNLLDKALQIKYNFDHNELKSQGYVYDIFKRFNYYQNYTLNLKIKLNLMPPVQ